MKRIIEVEKEYKTTGKKAIDKFFAKHKELEYWKGTFEWMLENNVDFFSDTLDAMGNKIDWTYALHLDAEETYTYICIIERA